MSSSVSAQPQPLQWWGHKKHTDDRAYFIGRTPDGEMVWQCRGDSVEVGNLDWSDWEHLPDCDSWVWESEPVPGVPVALYWYDGAIVGRYADSPVTDPSFVPIHSDGNGGWFIERSEDAGN